ncbi:hypothetical protein [Savagea faecisuis]|uniref:Uncharacterized protein n=1 Tax=Savagea faecisuis TaxID=1274803 RepID=A0ABW3GTF4_9BACL
MTDEQLKRKLQQDIVIVPERLQRAIPLPSKWERIGQYAGKAVKNPLDSFFHSSWSFFVCYILPMIPAWITLFLIY